MKCMAPEKCGAFYYRAGLSREAQIIYDKMYAQFLRKDYSGVTKFHAGDADKAVEDSFSAYRALKKDHPEFFFLGNKICYRVRGSEAKLEYIILYPPETIARIQRVLEQKIKEYARGTDKMSAYKKEKLIYKRIVHTVCGNKERDYRNHNVVGPILYGEGCCEGQSALLILCLRYAGIPAICVNGRSKRDRGHSWVVLWMNGDPVHADITWESRTTSLRYRYFNLSDRQIAKDHFDFQNTGIPKCEEECWNDWRMSAKVGGVFSYVS